MSEHDCPVESLLAQIGRLDNTPDTIAAMQRGLDRAWAAIDQAAEQEGTNGHR